MLLSQFYGFCRDLGVRTIYIRSDIPEETVAVKFYKKMGCRQATPGTIPWQTATGPVDVVTHLYEPDFEIYSGPTVPMEISIDDAASVRRDKNREFKYRPLKKRSLPITDVIDFRQEK